MALAPLGVVFSSQTMTGRYWAGVYLSGLVLHLWVLDWMRTLYGGAGFHGSYVSGWLISGQIGALLFCLLVAAGRRGVCVAKLPVTIVLPLVWMSYEFLQCQVTALFGPGGTPLVSLAYTQADNAVIAQIAALGGAGLITLVVAATNGFVYDTLCWVLSAKNAGHRRPRTTRVALIPLTLIAVFLYGQVSLNRDNSMPGPTVCLMGLGDLPPLLGEDRIQGAPQFSTTATNHTRPDLLVWPELAYHHVLVTAEGNSQSLKALDEACPLANGDVRAYSHTVRRYLEQSAADLQAGILIGCECLVHDDKKVKRYNRLTYIDPVEGLISSYDKRHLAPFTEFTPAYGRWLQIANRKDFTHGQKATPFILRTNKGDQEYRVGCGLCYDVAFDEHFLQQQQSGNIAFYVVSGSEVADATGSMSQMLLHMAQLRAIETRRPIIRNTHLGFSGLIDAKGRVIHCNDRGEISNPWLLGAVPLNTRVSLYSQMGNWISPTCFGLLLALLIKPTMGTMRLPFRRTQPNAEYQHAPSLPSRLTISRRQAFSLLELMAVITILGTITALLIPRVSASAAAANEASDGLNRAMINVAVERWYLEQGIWPANNLSDLGADTDYFPEGIPTNPVDGTPYALNATTHRVIVSGGGGGGK